MFRTYKSTTLACYTGYITQAAVNNLAPILFIVFQQKFSIGYELISLLIITNFATQLIVDGLAVKLCKVISTRTLISAAHFFCGAGLIMMGMLPSVIDNTFAALMISVITYAVGGGLIEVLVSPIIEAIPNDSGSAKASAMSLLHSFYCWGQMTVVLLSTGYIFFFGDEYWYLLPVIWGLLPIINGFVFIKVPLSPSLSEDTGIPLLKLLRERGFVLILLLMLCAGACELTMSQWSSLFAQRGLLVSKQVGDLLGPCCFALLMGTGRVLNSIFAKRINMYALLCFSGLLCLTCYITVALSDNAILSLIFCALCGLSVAVLWPGTFSLAAADYKKGGTGMFGIMALLGDCGCGFGPFLAGMICDAVTGNGGTEAVGMKTGFAFSTIFPLLLIGSSLILYFMHKKTKKN